ncbi:glycosyltransferase [Rhabdobacter roseus]|uniref:Glycosyltransferase involved in cell wall biosynthesis n=1 Tax=Rhabdobacter roseus TaxID=1655419 RepID=A0A840TQ07_9BACT|nr:glycosyltransferase [Rhabdobacter roseus]MBB5283642.1 glycosyltransferase involved in cell wall biosynthesis [Rhabdobacter roseus]
MRYYSIIIPVYNRPDELDELLGSLTRQTYRDFEVLVIEDGSSRTSQDVVQKYLSQLTIRYFVIENRGQGFARNYGFAQARGEYFVVFDSDTLIPPHYLASVDSHLNQNYLDAYGGPDAADKNFSSLQKAISYAMTSVFTTGGIRGKKNNAGGAFQPRSFNLGLSRRVFEDTGGFAKRDMGEDIEFGIRLRGRGYRLGLIPDAYVFHKRRGTFQDFFRQVYSFGRTRFGLHELHPEAGLIKPVHAFPSVFVVFCLLIPFWALVSEVLFGLSAYALLLFMALILVDATAKEQSLKVGFLSVAAAFVQLFGYGLGFIQEGTRWLARKRQRV